MNTQPFGGIPSMISIQRWAIALGATGLTALCFGACGGEEDASEQSALDKALSALPPEQRPKIERGESGEIRYEGQTQSGEKYVAQLGGNVTLPANFPGDLPLYPDAVPFSAMETGGGTTIVSLDSDKQAPEVYGFYKEQLPASGWAIENELNVGGQRVLTAVKGDRKVVVQIESTKKGARIGYQLGPVS
jgi:hypothetical protein